MSELNLDDILNEVEEAESVEVENPFPKSSLDNAKEVPDDVLSILDNELDPEELAKAESELYLQKGTYRFETVDVRIGFLENDKRATDVAQKKGIDKGRCMFNVYGTVVEVDTKRKGRFTFTCSPDMRYRKDSSGNLVDPPESDMFSRLYAMWTAFYFNKFEKKPKSDRQVLELITSKAYTMYLTLSKNGTNYLSQIKEV